MYAAAVALAVVFIGLKLVPLKFDLHIHHHHHHVINTEKGTVATPEELEKWEREADSEPSMKDVVAGVNAILDNLAEGDA